MEERRQTDPWGSQTSQSSLRDKFEASKRPWVKKPSGQLLRTHTQAWSRAWTYMHTHVTHLGQEREGDERTALEMLAVRSGPDPGHRNGWNGAAVQLSGTPVLASIVAVICIRNAEHDPVGGRLCWTGSVRCCAEDGYVASACACMVWFFGFFSLKL